MFCHMCGNKLDDDSVFCQKCGNKTAESIGLIQYNDEHCHISIHPRDITNKVVAVKADCLQKQFQKTEYQLVYVDSGKGANAGSLVGDINCVTLYNDNAVIYDRRDIIGEVKLKFIPDWAIEKLERVYGITSDNITLQSDVTLSQLENERIDVVAKYLKM